MTWVGSAAAVGSDKATVRGFVSLPKQDVTLRGILALCWLSPSGLCPELLSAGGGTLQPCSRAAGDVFLSWHQQQEGSLRRAAALHLQAANSVVLRELSVWNLLSFWVKIKSSWNFQFKFAISSKENT